MVSKLLIAALCVTLQFHIIKPQQQQYIKYWTTPNCAGTEDGQVDDSDEIAIPAATEKFYIKVNGL